MTTFGMPAFQPMRRPPLSPGVPWMVTFIDLSALLITFMVMLFAMSALEEETWEKLRLRFTEGDELRPTVTLTLPDAPVPLTPSTALPGRDLDYLAQLLRQSMPEDGRLGRVEIRRLEDRLVIALPSRLLFAPGAVALDSAGLRAVAGLTAGLRNIDNRIEVVGHADPRPVPEAIGSNWELSLGRAMAVAALIEAAGYRRPLIARGEGDSRFAQTAPEAAPDERQDLARRVDIVIHRDLGEVLP